MIRVLNERYFALLDPTNHENEPAVVSTIIASNEEEAKKKFDIPFMYGEYVEEISEEEYNLYNKEW